MIIFLLVLISVVLGIMVFGIIRHNKWMQATFTNMMENDKILAKNQAKIHQELIRLESINGKNHQKVLTELTKIEDSVAKSKQPVDPTVAKNHQKIMNELIKIKSEINKKQK